MNAFYARKQTKLTHSYGATSVIVVALLALTSLLTTGCGAANSYPAYGGASTIKKSSSTNNSSNSYDDSDDGDDSHTVENPNGSPLKTERVGAVGYSSYSFTVSTNKVLKMKFSPGVQDEIVSGTGYTAQYSALGVYIKVGTQEQPTALLFNGLNSGSAESSTVMDFSDAFTHSCSSADDACRQTVTITVSKPNYDYYCYNFGTYCSYTKVYSTHPWHGTLTYQTDDTVGF